MFSHPWTLSAPSLAPHIPLGPRSRGSQRSQEMLCWDAHALPVQVFRCVCVLPAFGCVFALMMDTDAPVCLQCSCGQQGQLACLLRLLSILLAPEQLPRPCVNSQGAIALQKPYYAAVFKSKTGKKGFSSAACSQAVREMLSR